MFAREKDGQRVMVAVNNADAEATVSVGGLAEGAYFGALSGQTITAAGGGVTFTIPGHGGEIWVSEGALDGETAAALMVPVEAVKAAVAEKAAEKESAAQAVAPAPSPADPSIPAPAAVPNKPYEEMTVEELQSAILEKLAKNGPVTDQMRRDVADNVWHDSLVNWVKSFR